MTLVLILKLCALQHLGLVAAGALMPGVVRLREHVAILPAFIRQLIWVYYGFVGLCLVSFGLGTFVFADELAAGSTPARAICGFLMLFWFARLAVATFVFDLRPYLTTPLRRLGLAAANTVFGILPAVYGYAAFRPTP